MFRATGHFTRDTIFLPKRHFKLNAVMNDSIHIMIHEDQQQEISISDLIIDDEIWFESTLSLKGFALD
jgi:hypothetical protein